MSAKLKIQYSKLLILEFSPGAVGGGDFQLPAQSVPIATKVVERQNPTHGEVYSIQHYVINLVSDLWQVGDFLRVLRFPLPIKLTATIYLKYCESGVNHHNHNPISIILPCYIYAFVNSILSCNQYICCTNMLYE